MRYFFMLLILAGCSTSSVSKYKKQYHLEDYKSSMAPSEVHGMLLGKMTKCYPQSEYPVMEKTFSKFDAAKEEGVISYEMDNQGVSRERLVLVEVAKDEGGSLVRVYAKGNFLRPGSMYKHHIHKWLDGKKVDCDSQGKI